MCIILTSLIWCGIPCCMQWLWQRSKPQGP